jgi:hypothetical protein
MIFHSSLISGKIVWIGIFSPITFFKQETWNIGCTHEDGRNFNLSAILPILCNLGEKRNITDMEIDSVDIPKCVA